MATYGPEETERLREYVMEHKHNAGAEDANPAESFFGRRPPRELRSQQFLAVASVLYVATLLLDRGYVGPLGGFLFDWSGTGGAGETVCLHTLAYALCNLARDRGVPGWQKFAAVFAPTGTAARRPIRGLPLLYSR